MKQSKKALYLAVFIVSIFTVGGMLDLEGPAKITFTGLSLLVAAYGIANTFFGANPFVINLNYRLKKIEVLKIIITQGAPGISAEGAGLTDFKSNLLSYTIDQLGNRTELINGPDIYTVDFIIDHESVPGSKTQNQSAEWEKHLDKQFTVITGISGNGKTFELMKRVSYLCKTLEPGIEDYEYLEKKKIPLYIELKSLNGELNETWIINYVKKTSVITRQDVDPEQLKILIEKNLIVYFFDGLDEVLQEYRIDAAKSIVALSNKTGVHVSCRDNIFDDMITNPEIFPTQNKPFQYRLRPLTKAWIENIILTLDQFEAPLRKEMADFVTNKPKLFEHLSRPILLNLFISVYRNLDQSEKKRLGSSDLRETMAILWENYEDLIFQKKMPEDTDILGIRTISVWLAKIMGADKSFYIESIQPSWLKRIREGVIEDDRRIQRYYYFTTRIIASIIVGIALACIISTPFALVSTSVVGGIVISILAGIYNYKPSKIKIPAGLSNTLLYLSMIVCLSLVCGVFQGLSVPRSPVERYNDHFSLTECWPGILVGITLSVIFSYRIIHEHKKAQYILPVELFHFEWGHAFLYGISWAFATSLTTGCIAYYVKKQFPSGRFIKDWLMPTIKKILIWLDIDSSVKSNVNFAIFLYAFAVTFLISSIIIVLMAGRDPSKEKFDTIKNKQKLNFAIKQSIRHAFFHSLRVALTTFVFYTMAVLLLRLSSYKDAFILAFGLGILVIIFIPRYTYIAQFIGTAYATLILIYFLGSWVNGAMIATGVFILVFLWFGGMEVMNHVALRLNLYSRGIAPLNYDTWVQAQQNMGLIIPSGFQMTFYHQSLGEYYADIDIKSSTRIRPATESRSDIIIYRGIAVFLICLVIAPFVLKYGSNVYSAGIRDVQVGSELVSKNLDSTYTFRKAGSYLTKISGHMNVGTFVGWSAPEGTRFGFLGMPIDGVYNLPGLEDYNHAALMYRTLNSNDFIPAYQYLKQGDTLRIEIGDRLDLVVNDKEWENNTGRYKVEFTFCSDCNTPSE